ncbi:MAG: nucleotidyl transferase AbiEii/AbiGii toxin family protein [Bacteroidales bacterium]|nr:nucleotidyl transferase AbiEii/AbiGii toxin family protein [Bacteroidales bacterium]
MLHFETIDPRTLRLLKELQSESLFLGTRLVGGTALALQLGHRGSIDLDLFGSLQVQSEEIRVKLSDAHRLTVLKESDNINIYLIDDVKVDFVNYKYGWIDDAVRDEGISLAGIKDIAAMKIAAIIGRGSKKDFIDLYFLLRFFSLSDILDLYMLKYPDGSVFTAMKSLTFFEDAESDPMPVMFEGIGWEAMKTTVLEAVKAL